MYIQYILLVDIQSRDDLKHLLLLLVERPLTELKSETYLYLIGSVCLSPLLYVKIVLLYLRIFLEEEL